jgi:hypothetical protein
LFLSPFLLLKRTTHVWCGGAAVTCLRDDTASSSSWPSSCHRHPAIISRRRLVVVSQRGEHGDWMGFMGRGEGRAAVMKNPRAPTEVASVLHQNDYFGEARRRRCSPSN